ncbi:MAG: phage portal protein [Oscillospiraceae bacterium]|jgi:hypothetical protein|nr:phage portal protein [Oscillospiraceae bacterium]
MSQTARKSGHPFGLINSYSPLRKPENIIYEQMRQAVPIIDAGIQKIIRLMGNFKISCGDEYADELLRRFLENVPVSGTGLGISSFLYAYMDSLLTCGNALGEIVLDSGGGVYGLFNPPLDNIEIKRSSNGFDVELCVKNGKSSAKLANNGTILFSALNPRAGEVSGRSILEGLPFVASILLEIYNSIGQNFERMGSLRFAVTYTPPDSGAERAYTQERAEAIAREWQEAMSGGPVKDFMAVGDVNIKVIGADNQIIDTNVPVRQMLEQIVAKLGVPPFLLGLSWSTTERMSSQQADMLTSELVSYQTLMNPVILKICRFFLRSRGISAEPRIEWQELCMQDITEDAKARLVNAQADKIRRELENL